MNDFSFILSLTVALIGIISSIGYFIRYILKGYDKKFLTKRFFILVLTVSTAIITGTLILTTTNIIIHPPTFNVVTPTSTTPPTASASTIFLNKRLVCVSCELPSINVIINKVIINDKDSNMIWAITIENNANKPQSLNFSNFSLQDPNGVKYIGAGGILNSFTINPGQVVQATVIYSFVPKTGEVYVLQASLNNQEDVFQAESFTF